MYQKWDLPPCPNPEQYIAVRVGNLYYWRRKRGTVKRAVLNESFTSNTNNAGITQEAASDIMEKLEPFLRGLIKGRLHTRISGRLKKGLNKTGSLDYEAVKGLDLQKDYPLSSMFRGSGLRISVSRKNVNLSFEFDNWTVKPLNKLVTEYFFEIILLHGELLSKKGLRTETETSELFTFHNQDNKKIPLSLSLLLPEKSPWMLIFRVSCLEGNEKALHPKHHVLRVVAAGKGRKEQEERVRV